MSFAANPNKPQKGGPESAEAIAAKKQKADRTRIRKLIITLGDDTSKKISSQIKGLAGAFEDDMELHGEIILETVLSCVQYLPLKTGIYAALVVRLAEKHDRWAASLVDSALQDIRVTLRSGKSSASQLMARFFVCLGNCGYLGLSNVVDFLKEVAALSTGLKAAKGGDFGAYLLLTSLPYLSQAAFKLVTDGVDSLLANAGAYLEAREASWKQVIRPGVVEEGGPPALDRMEALAKALKGMREGEWTSQAILHVPGFTPSLEGKAGAPKLALQVTAEDVKKSKFRFLPPLCPPRIITSSFADDGADDQLAEHDRWFLEDNVLLTIEYFTADVEECCKQILRIPVMHPHFEAVVVELVFSQMMRLPTPPALPIFYTRILEGMGAKQESMKKFVDQGYMALYSGKAFGELDEECLDILAEGFAYHLMQHSYEANWEPFLVDNAPTVSTRFIRRTLQRLQRLSFHQNLLHRLPEALHVFMPPEPLPARDLPCQAKPHFAKLMSLAKIKDPDEQGVINYCRRLMRPREASDVKMEAAAPVEPPTNEQATAAEKQEKAQEKAADDTMATKKQRLDEEGTAAPVVPMKVDSTKAEADSKENVKTDTGAVKRPADEEVKQEVKQEEVEGEQHPERAKSELKGEDEADALPVHPWSLEEVADVLTAALLQNGSRTPTHMSKVLDGHDKVFAALKPKDEEEALAFTQAVVRCIFKFWKKSGQRLEITFDAMLNRGILHPHAVIECALADCLQASDSMAAWNVVNSVARKSLEKLQTSRAELAIAKKLEKVDAMEKLKKQMEAAMQETAELFTLIFSGLVRNYQDLEEKNATLRQVTLQRVLAIGRKYHAFIKPLVNAAESRIPGVAHNPEIAAVFENLRAL
eukprot:TRINITY_DN80058_c0_g1_i1.p1 TRINITY_DN80058_c0_g1~~TRINITY_DN80058_c0_g1_i1.p1  ORF type:complete len:873 (-),score=282.30 TRINITY_DN80058_c0_g1_i1:42-2660(-)